MTENRPRDAKLYDLPLDDPQFLADLSWVECLIQYTFKDRMGIREGLYTDKTRTGRLPDGVLLTESNYGIGQLGDAIMKATVMDFLIDERREYNGERLSRGKVEVWASLIVRETYLGHRADELGISALIKTRYHSKWLGVKAYSTTIEAIIGAVYRDCAGDPVVLRRVVGILLGVNLVADESRAVAEDGARSDQE